MTLELTSIRVVRVRVVYNAYPAVVQRGLVGQAPARRVGLARRAREVQRR